MGYNTGMKRLLGVIFSFVILSLSTQPVFAQGGNLENVSAIGAQSESNNLLFEEQQPTSMGFFQVAGNSFMAQIACQLDATNCGNSGGGKSTTASISKAFAFLYTPQADTQTYIADLMNTAGLNIAQPAYAQGLGFSSLDPVLDTWKAFRNVAYLFYVLMFLVIGFMIMFRRSISSQAAISAQQALPKIIVSLIAVTFSYAIAGLLIDVMYLVMFLIVGLFPSATFANDLSLRQIAMDRNIFAVGFYLLTSGGALGSAQVAVSQMIENALQAQIGGFADALGQIGGLTFAVVFALAVLFGLFRMFFELLKTYISIIIAIVLSPLALMLGALPGNNAFQAWIKTLVANLAVFPGILIIIVLAFMLIGGQYAGSNTSAQQIVPQVQAQDNFFRGQYNGGFLPPYIPGTGSGNAISIMIGLGVILIMPDLVLSIKKTIGGSGGIFEQFANNFTSNLEKGWKGGELVPGLGISDTRKWPAGGLTGQNITSKAATTAAGVGGGIAGVGSSLGIWGVKNATRGRVFGSRVVDPVRSGRSGAAYAGQRVSDAIEEKNLFAKFRKERKEGKKKYGQFK